MTGALRRFVGDYRRLHTVAPHTDRVLDWLCACRTAALGGRMVSCTCGYRAALYNGCGDRHCPQCRGAARATWLQARTEQLLPVPHFQVVATLPGVLRPLAAENPALVYAALFRALSDTLATLGAQRLGVQLGVVSVLHTWTSDLRYHPHVHALVTAGGLRLDGEAWVQSRPEYLFPTRVMAAMVRGKVTAALRKAFGAGDLYVRGPPEHTEVAFRGLMAAAHRHRWVVHIEAPQGRPVDTVAKYLARYVHGVALSDGRMRAVTATEVTFATRRGDVTLDGVEFVRRFVSHVLPRRFRKVRYFGLYAPGSVHTHWTRARQLLSAPMPAPRPVLPVRTCPACGRQTQSTALPGLPVYPPPRPPRARGPP